MTSNTDKFFLIGTTTVNYISPMYGIQDVVVISFYNNGTFVKEIQYGQAGLLVNGFGSVMGSNGNLYIAGSDLSGGSFLFTYKVDKTSTWVNLTDYDGNAVLYLWYNEFLFIFII